MPMKSSNSAAAPTPNKATLVYDRAANADKPSKTAKLKSRCCSQRTPFAYKETEC